MILTPLLPCPFPQVRQLFERHPSSSPAECSTARLDFFKKALWPRIKQSAPRGLLLLVPHYFDYVRLRNFLLEEDAEYAELCEYTDQKEVGGVCGRGCGRGVGGGDRRHGPEGGGGHLWQGPALAGGMCVYGCVGGEAVSCM